jgi:hypothetical protein
LSCTAGTGKSYTQSFQYTPYEPGKSQFIKITGVAKPGVANTTVDYMYGDSINAVMFRQNGATTWQLILRTRTSGSIVETTVARSAWTDKADGTGKCPAIVLDSNAIFFFRLQYLGMGQISCGVSANGVNYELYKFNNAFQLNVPYMQSASLPVGMLVTSTGSGATKTAYFKCASVESEGGISDFDAFQFSTPEATETAGSGTRTHLVSIRPKTTFNSLINRENFQLVDIDILVTGSNPVFWELVIGATTASSTWADVNSTYSAFEYTSVRGSFTNLTGGVVIASGYAQGTGGGSNPSMPNTIAIEKIVGQKYPITLDRNGAARTLGTMSLIITGIGGTSATRAVLNYKETR